VCCRTEPAAFRPDPALALSILNSQISRFWAYPNTGGIMTPEFSILGTGSMITVGRGAR